jgi:hypothetical protein
MTSSIEADLSPISAVAVARSGVDDFAVASPTALAGYRPTTWLQ